MSEFLSFLKLNNILYIPHFVYPYVNGQFSCFHLLAIVNNSVVNMGVQIYLRDPVSGAFGHICRSGIAGSYGILLLN